MPSKTAAVTADLRRRILAGDFPDDLPLKKELQRQYGSSVHVLAGAFNQLAREGLVTRPTTRGTWRLACLGRGDIVSLCGPVTTDDGSQSG